MKQEEQAPQNESNAGGGMIDNPPRKLEAAAAQKVADAPGSAEHAAGMDNQEGNKDNDTQPEQEEKQ